MTSLPFPPGATRHPFSPSSGCHNHPDAVPGPANDQGPPAVVAVAFEAEQERLFSYVRRRVGIDAAADIVQDIYARAAGSRQADRLVNPAGFLQRIARNLLIDRSRRERTSAGLVVAFDEARDAASPPEQEWGLEAADLLRLYETAVAGLPEKTRRVFLMHRVDEMSYRAIHEALGISMATVEYHMGKALAHIAREVGAAR